MLHSCDSATLQVFAVRILGNISTGDAAQTQLAVDAGALTAFLQLLRGVSYVQELVF